MKNNFNPNYLLIPAIPIVIVIIIFITKNITTPSNEVDVNEAIKNNYMKNIAIFNETIDYLKSANTVWNNYEIHFHPGLGTKFHAYGLLDTTRITHSEYKSKNLMNTESTYVNDYPDFSITETNLNAIKNIGISNIIYFKDSINVFIKFQFEYRKYAPVENNYFLIYSANHILNKHEYIWINKINDTIYSCSTN